MMNRLKPGFYAVAIVIALLVTAAWFQVSPRLSGDKISASKSPAWSAEAGFRAEGTVLDDNAKPISGVKVYALWEAMDSPRKWLVRDTCTSDQNGRFVFESLPWLVREREYVLIAYAPGRFLGETDSRIYANIGSRDQRTVDSDLVIQLHKLETFTGRVVDQKGQGLGGVNVRVSRMIADGQFIDCDDWPIPKIPEAVTDSGGNYKLAGVPNGFRLLVKAQKSGYVQYPRTYDSDPKRIAMVSSARVVGKLIDQSGTGIPNTDIRADAERFGGYGRTKTDKRGVYEVDVYPAGKYSISALVMKGQIAKSLRNVRTELGKTVQVSDLIAIQTAPLRGNVTGVSGSEPIFGFVNLIPESYRFPIIASSRLDDRNRYEFGVLPGETYKIEFSGSGPYSLDGRSSVIKITGRNPVVDLRLRKVPTAFGYLIDQYGLPLEGAVITIPEYGAQVAAGPLYGRAVTENNGSYEIGINPRLAARKDGRIIVRAYHNQRHLALSESVDVQSFLYGKPKLTLQPTEMLKVTVLGGENKPASGVTVYIYPDFPGGGSIQTDRNGTAVFDICPGVKYHLIAQNRYASKRYPESGEISTADKVWKSEVTIKLR